MSDFDYKGIDEQEKQDAALINLKHVENEIRKIYIDRLERFNKDSLEQNPEPFRFLKEENCSLMIFILPYEFDLSQSVQSFIVSTPGDRFEKVIVLGETELSDLDSYKGPFDFFRDKILPTHGVKKSQVIVEMRDRYSSIGNNNILSDHFDLERYIVSQGLKSKVITSIKDEISQFKSVNEKKLSYFAKDAYKFPFSLFDLKPLVSLVDDEDFTYQLDQAMAAYHENLFLPSAATLGVVLETLCLKILEENGVTKVKSGDTQLGKLKDRLAD